MLSFYLDEEAFDKEVMSWPGVKHNPHKSGMHYLLPAELLKKKGQEAGVGPSSGPEEKKKDAPMHTDSEEEEEETQPLECKKRTFPMFPQLPEQAMLTGKDVNDILNATFIGDPLVKKPRTGLSLVKILNPQPISSTIPHTRATTRVTQTIIDIQDDPEPDTTASTTIITEQPPSPPQPQSPPQEMTIQPQTTEPEPMQLDPPEPTRACTRTHWSDPEVLSQSIVPFVPIQDTLPLMETQIVPIPQAPSPQRPLSTVNVESAIQRSGTTETVVQKEAEVPEVQKEPEMTSGQSATSLQEKLELVLQNPQQCAELVQLCLVKTKMLPFLPSVVRMRLVQQLQGPSTGEEEVETPSEHSMASGLPLQVRVPREATTSSGDLAQWPSTQLIGMIRASTDQLEQRLQQAEWEA
jgi:hypothetical protein